MLTSLIAVLLLLVIGFYTVFIGAVGRAGSGEAPLTAPRRLGMIVIGLAALGVAYLVYSHPRSLQSASRAPASWNAMPSNPPETRGDEADEPGAPASGVAETEAPAEADGGPAVQATPPTPAVAESAPAEGEGSASAAALAMEAELMRRRRGLAPVAGESQAPAPALIAEAPPAPATRPAAESRSGTAPAPKSAGRSSVPRRATAPTRAVGPLQPLTIVIHNELGDRQQREKLSLTIEGKRVASFEITDAAPSIELPIRLPRPGLVHYRLEGESVQGRRQSLSGQGCISAVDGARFHVRRNPGSRRVFLESTSG